MTFSVNYQQRHLRDKLEAHFDQEEIKSLCFDLHLDWDNLAGETKRAKIESLLTELEQNNRLDDLITGAQQLRPNVVWKVGAPADAPCPYRGLFAFREEDTSFFFGRETFTGRLIEAVQRRPLVAVIGPSGSGKSSVVFAGLLPELRQEGKWLIASFRPGKQPFRALVAALISLLEPDLSETERLLEVRRLAEALAESELLLSDVLGRILEKYSNTARLLFVVDQFEELYSLCPDEGERRRFLDALLAASGEAELHLVMTLRAGFLGQALAYRPFADALQDSDVKLGPMTREEMQRAIEQPTLKVGVSFADGLVLRILDDVEGEPGGLPLLEFTLTLLWELQEGGRLTHTAYEAVGGVVGALARYADDVYEGLSEVEQEQARHLFVQLVQPGSDTEDTRRIASQPELVGVDSGLVQRLTNARLVITGQDTAGQQTVELAHEALIQRWLRLRGWVEEERKFRSWQEQLRDDLSQWQASGLDDGALLRGGPLAEAESWYQQQAQALSEPERDFIQASRRWRRRNERLRNIAIVGSLVVAMLMLFLAALALNRGAEAERQRRLAVARELAVKSAAMLEVDPEESLRLAIQAVETTYRVDGTFVVEAKTALHHALGPSYTLSHSNDIYATAFGADGSHVIPADTEEIPVEVMAAAFSPDSSQIVTVGTDRTVRLWDATGRLLTVAIPMNWSTFFSPSGTHLLVTDSRGYVELWDTEGDRILAGQPHAQKVNAIAFSADGNYYVMGSQNGNASLWDLDGELLAVFRGHTDAVNAVAFSPDGMHITTGGNDKTARIWDTEGASLATLEGHTGAINAVAFSSGGLDVITASDDGTARVWDLEGNLLEVLEGHTSAIDSVVVALNGQRLVTIGDDSYARLWDLEGNLLAVLKGHEGPLSTAVFSSDSAYFLTASDDKTARLWDSDGNLLKVLEGHEDVVNSVAFSPDGAYILTASDDKTARLWDSDGNLLVVMHHEAPIRSVSFSEDGARIFTSSSSGTVFSWDMEGKWLDTIVDEANLEAVTFSPDGRRIAVSMDRNLWLWNWESNLFEILEGHSESIYTVQFSPDGARLVTASADGTARVWDAEGDLQTILEGHDAPPRTAIFSPDGAYVLTAGYDNTARLWDLEGTMLAVLEGHTERIDVDVPRDVIWDLDANIQVTTTGWINTANFSPDGTRILTGGSDGIARLWDLDGDLLNILEGHIGQVESAVFSLDGTRILTGGSDDAARLWDLEGNLLKVLESGSPIWTAVFSPDGSRILTTSSQELRLWRTEGNLFTVLEHPKKDEVGIYFSSTTFSPDGTRILTTSFGDAAHLWDLEIEGMLAAAKEALEEVLEPDPQAEAQRRLAAENLDACNQAVASASDYEAEVFDSRGVARALTGDYAGAIEDFQYFVDWSKENDLYEEYVVTREAWIVALKAGRNPFDEATLEALKNE